MGQWEKPAISRRRRHEPDRSCRFGVIARRLSMAVNASRGDEMDDKTKEALEAAAFRRLVSHLRERSDVQNIDMMITAGFCRNCLGDWYREAAAERGIALGKDE